MRCLQCRAECLAGRDLRFRFSGSEPRRWVISLRGFRDGTAIATVERAFELGINLLDTSPLYGRGLAEHRCGTALRRVPRQDIVVCTKVGRWMDPFHAPADGSGFVGGQPHRGRVRLFL